MGTPQRIAVEGLEAGWVALREGRWLAARSVFAEAVADRVTPEALEGLSWAAWWLDDDATLFATRREAYRRYRAAGDVVGAARTAAWLCLDELDFHGAAAVASGWLQRCRRLLAGKAPTPEHGWLAFAEGYLASLGGDAVTARERAVRTADLGRRFGVPDLEMLGLALEGAELVGCGRVAAGMRRLDEATAVALEGEAVVPISGAWACCFLVTACSAVFDYERAGAWCDRIADFADRYGSRYMLAFCRAEYGAVHLWRGRWADAEAVLTASIDDFARSRPPSVSGPLSQLAELRRRQGRREEAARLVARSAESLTARLSAAWLAYDAGDAPQAVDAAERLLRQVPADRLLERVPAQLLHVHALVATGELDRAADALAAVREAARRAGTAPLRACVDVAEAALMAASGHHDGARRLLEDAVDTFERAGAPYETARARCDLAERLLVLGRPDAAAREAALALPPLRDLDAVFDVARAERLLRAASRDEQTSAPAVTPREREVLRLVVEGLTNREIADRLVVSEHTVHRHVSNILRKTGLPSRAAAAAHAVRTGLVAEEAGPADA